MLSKILNYFELVYVPAFGHPTVLEPSFRPKWAKIRRDAWGWLKDRFAPVENPFDQAWDEVFDSLIWEN